MGKLFGTDGVRGVAGKDLTCELALQIGRATAAELTSLDGHRPRILIGKDTRVSGDMLAQLEQEADALCENATKRLDQAVSYLVDKVTKTA